MNNFLTNYCIEGFDITIENPAGSVRSGTAANGKNWSTTMANTYGEFKGTESVDGDPIDVFLHTDMDQWDGRKVFVVDQTKPDGSFDEHKVMLGFNNKEEAEKAYFANYDENWHETHPGIRISESSIDDFRKWVNSSHRKTKPFADYSSTSAARYSAGPRRASGREAYEAAKDLVASTGIPVEEVSDAEARRKLDEEGIQLMGTRTDNKMKAVGNHFDGRQLDPNVQAVVDVFSGKADNLPIEATRPDGQKVRIIMRQGNDNRTGAKHSLFRHFETRSSFITPEDIAMIPEVIAKGERNTVKNESKGKSKKSITVASYDLFLEDGVRIRVTTEVKENGSEQFTNFYSNRKPLQSEAGVTMTTQLSARTSDAEESATKVDKNSDSIKSEFLTTPDGTVYGWVENGKIYLNRDAMNPESPIHEYTHLWDEMVRRENPKLWARGVELMKETPLWEEVMEDPAYSNIRHDENAVASEVHSRLTGRDGTRILQDMLDRAKGESIRESARAIGRVDRIRRWLSEMFSSLKATLSKWSGRDLKALTPEDFSRLTLRDLARGRDPRPEQTIEEITKDVSDKFDADIEAYKRGELPANFRFKLGNPYQELKDAGFPDFPIVLRKSVIEKKSATQWHPFDAENLKGLVEAVRNPLAIFSYTKENMRNLIVDLEKDGKHFLVGVTLGYKKGDIEVNSISGLFPKDDIEWLMWIQKGNLIRVGNKEKIQNLIDFQRTTNTVESERIGLDLNLVANLDKNFGIFTPAG